MNTKKEFLAGAHNGIPICLGYIAVSFTFGIMAKNAGLSVWEAVLLSAANLTSAGQFAGLSLIVSGSSMLEMAATQLIINLRYSLMSCSLSQKLDRRFPFFHRFLMSYGVTDEIFGVAACREASLSPFYFYGLISVAAPGWAFGTFLGIVSGNILPARIISALSVALYGMFIAIIIPPARENKIIGCTVVISMIMSLIFTKAPVLNSISSGFRIIILTLLIGGVCAFFFPLKEEGEVTEHES